MGDILGLLYDTKITFSIIQSISINVIHDETIVHVSHTHDETMKPDLFSITPTFVIAHNIQSIRTGTKPRRHLSHPFGIFPINREKDTRL